MKIVTMMSIFTVVLIATDLQKEYLLFGIY